MAKASSPRAPVRVSRTGSLAASALAKWSRDPCAKRKVEIHQAFILFQLNAVFLCLRKGTLKLKTGLRNHFVSSTMHIHNFNRRINT